MLRDWGLKEPWHVGVKGSGIRAGLGLGVGVQGLGFRV